MCLAPISRWTCGARIEKVTLWRARERICKTINFYAAGTRMYWICQCFPAFFVYRLLHGIGWIAACSHFCWHCCRNIIHSQRRRARAHTKNKMEPKTTTKNSYANVMVMEIEQFQQLRSVLKVELILCSSYMYLLIFTNVQNWNVTQISNRQMTHVDFGLENWILSVWQIYSSSRNKNVYGENVVATAAIVTVNDQIRLCSAVLIEPYGVRDMPSVQDNVVHTRSHRTFRHAFDTLACPFVCVHLIR